MHGRSKSPASPQGPRARSPGESPEPRGTHRDSRPRAKNLLSLPVGEYTDAVVQGLTLRVRPTGRWWALRYRASLGTGRGPQRRLHFGMVGGPVTLDLSALDLGGFVRAAGLTLEAARNVARALVGLAARGLDPVRRARDRRPQQACARGQQRPGAGRWVRKRWASSSIASSSTAPTLRRRLASVRFGPRPSLAGNPSPRARSRRCATSTQRP